MMTTGITIGALLVLGIVMSVGLDFIRNQLKTVLETLDAIKNYRTEAPMKEVRGPIEHRFEVPVTYERLLQINREIVEAQKTLKREHQAEVDKLTAQLAERPAIRKEMLEAPWAGYPETLEECRHALHYREKQVSDLYSKGQKLTSEKEETLKRAVIAEQELRKVQEELRITREVSKNACSEVSVPLDYKTRLEQLQSEVNSLKNRLEASEKLAENRGDSLDRRNIQLEEAQIEIQKLKNEPMTLDQRERYALEQALKSKTNTITSLESALSDMALANGTLERLAEGQKNELTAVRKKLADALRLESAWRVTAERLRKRLNV